MYVSHALNEKRASVVPSKLKTTTVFNEETKNFVIMPSPLFTTYTVLYLYYFVPRPPLFSD